MEKAERQRTSIFCGTRADDLFGDAAQITVVPINETIKAKRLEMSAIYPQLTGAANAAGFNRFVKTRIMNEIAAFKKQMMTVSAEDLKYLRRNK
jgi:hypothetical protein